MIHGPAPLFVVVPDIPYRGHASLDLSRLHLPVLRDMFPDRRFAVAVQDGVAPVADRAALLAFDVIFVAGSTEWKWAYCREWAEFARDFGKGIHIARVNVNHRIEYCRDLGVDSVDGTGAGRGGDITWNRLTRCLSQQRLSETSAE
jgi:hypothetical protein